MLNTNALETLGDAGLTRALGTGEAKAERASTPDRSGPGALVFASKPEQLRTALEQRASLIIADRRLELPAAIPDGTVIYQTAHVGLAMSRVLRLFDRKLERFAPLGQRHPQSYVDPTARIGKNVTIGAFTVIGPDVEIGDDCVIGSQVTLEKGARLGARCLLHPQVFIGADCELGSDCELQPHVTIGADGFGYAQDKQFNHHKLPQLGRVVLGDRVEIGANSAVDRAAFNETRIGSGSKIDNLCHIAHNCEIGENAVIAGGFLAAGSTRIGRNFMAGGATAVGDHIEIADNVVVAGRSAIASKVEKPGVYGGYPLEPMRDHLRTLASLPHLVSLRRQMARVLKHLNLEEEK